MQKNVHEGVSGLSVNTKLSRNLQSDMYDLYVCFSTFLKYLPMCCVLYLYIFSAPIIDIYVL
jgi:hypothetical protein